MDLDTDDDVLSALAAGKSMDYEQWPSLLSRLIPRLEKIIKEDFPFPIPPIVPSEPISTPATQETKSDPSSQDITTPTDKENAAPALPLFPPQIQTLLTSITTTLTTLFSTHPPHTIQRFAELLLTPKQHYRTLPSYLHALDRVVHVTSSAQTFPLPPAIPDPSSHAVLSNGTSLTKADPLSISWGNPTSNPSLSLGSDESLGGALLTPITWLSKSAGSTGTHSPLEGEVKTESTEIISGPNGPGGVETVSVSVNGVSSAISASSGQSTAEQIDLAEKLRAEGGITQGELLRQEQKAGVVPAAQLVGKNVADESGMGEEDEVPHARGPEEIGIEDMGPQGGSATERGGVVGMQGIDVEAAVGRRVTASTEGGEVKDEARVEAPTTPKREAEDELAGEGKKLKSEPETSPAADVMTEEVEMVDANGKTGDEAKVGEEEENKDADAVV